MNHPDFIHLEALLTDLTDQGILPMAAMTVYRGGREVFRFHRGLADHESGRVLDSNTLFRIFSMTKVVTTVALLQLYESGRVLLSDPVSKYIPSFAHQRVWHTDAQGRTFYTPVQRENTLHDLLNMTSGIPYYHPGRSAVEDQMAQVWARMDDAIRAGKPWDTFTAVNEIGKNPLLFDPGTHFHYGLGIDVIGGVIEQVTKMRLGDYFKAHIFNPLGMDGTDFYVSPDRQQHLAQLYNRKNGGGFVPANRFQDLRQLSRPAYEEGGDGLVTTPDAYMTFARMLLGQGSLNGARILGRKTVALMARNHLPEALLPDVTDTMASVAGYGFGLGCRVMIDPARTGLNGSEGEFGWFGHGGSWFCVDPQEDMAAVFMTQVIFDKSEKIAVTPRIVQALYSAL